MVTSNSSPDSSSGKRQTLISPSARKETYERGLATIPLPTLSRRVHAPVTWPQQWCKRLVMLAIRDWVFQFGTERGALDGATEQFAQTERKPNVAAFGLHRVLSFYADRTLSTSVLLLVRRALALTCRCSKDRLGRTMPGFDNLRSPRDVLAIFARKRIVFLSIGCDSERLTAGSAPACNDEQKITSHLNLSSDQCRYDHRMRVGGSVRSLAGF